MGKPKKTTTKTTKKAPATKGQPKPQEPTKKQNDSHDWFGDVAESYVRYVAAKAGLDVFGGGKWTADAVLLDWEERRMWRVEVRSKDRDEKPARKEPETLQRHADVIAEVRLAGSLLKLEWFGVDDNGDVDGPKVFGEDRKLRNWLLQQGQRWRRNPKK